MFHFFATSCLGEPLQEAEGGVPHDPEKSWEFLQDRLPGIAGTGPYRCLVRASKLLYDFDGFPLDERRYHDLRERMTAAYGKEDWYIRALRKAGISAVVWAASQHHLLSEQEADFFLPTPNLDDFIRAYRTECKARLEKKYRVRLQEFQDVADLLTKTMSECDGEGIPAFWMSYCTFRPLRVDGADKQDADTAFHKPPDSITPQEAKLFEDHMIHRVTEQCAALNIPLQIDTGAAPEMPFIEHGDPCQTTGLVAQHISTRFVFLHAAAPFVRHLGALAKTFRNIYIDGSTLAGQSPSAMQNAIGEWLELVPVAKILFWGGDSEHIERTVGSLILARESLCRMLCERVENGLFSEELAFDLVSKLLRDVPRRFFRVDEVRVRRQVWRKGDMESAIH
ncbi:MAG: amidohydrolase family protein [Planctomycetota bacterium]